MRGNRKKSLGHMLLAVATVAICVFAGPAFGSIHGPWNTKVLQGGIGFTKSLPAQASVLNADSDWTLYAWVHPQFKTTGRQLLAGFGDPTDAGHYFFIDHGKLGFWSGKGSVLQSQARMHAGSWQFVAAVANDGQLTLYMDGKRVATGPVHHVAVSPQLIIGPVAQPWPHATHFGGKVATFTSRTRRWTTSSSRHWPSNRRIPR